MQIDWFVHAKFDWLRGDLLWPDPDGNVETVFGASLERVDSDARRKNLTPG